MKITEKKFRVPNIFFYGLITRTRKKNKQFFLFSKTWGSQAIFTKKGEEEKRKSFIRHGFNKLILTCFKIGLIFKEGVVFMIGLYKKIVLGENIPFQIYW